jgi:GNAT superfamily N-acetyltransferase
MVTPIHYQRFFSPTEEQLAPVRLGLHRYNLAHVGQESIEKYLRFVIQAINASEEVIGGIHAEMFWDWMYIRDLWITESERGQGIGTRLLAQAEETARETGFFKSHLETTEYQARDFYKKFGYVIFGELPDKPKGHTWYYMKKDLI